MKYAEPFRWRANRIKYALHTHSVHVTGELFSDGGDLSDIVDLPVTTEEEENGEELGLEEDFVDIDSTDDIPVKDTSTDNAITVRPTHSHNHVTLTITSTYDIIVIIKLFIISPIYDSLQLFCFFSGLYEVMCAFFRAIKNYKIKEVLQWITIQ